jgi:Plasmid pRiA4b ORF-3-like protein
LRDAVASADVSARTQSPFVYVFDAELVDYPGVGCTIGVRGGQTLDHLHHGLRRAFRWDDDHLYSFWLSGVHWDSPETEFTAPFDHEESEARSAAVRLDSLALEPKKPIAYVFDFGDSWHVMLELREIVALEPGARYPKLLDRRGQPPPQYTYEDELDE